MGFSFNSIDINISLYHRVSSTMYEERYGDRFKPNIYVVDDPKVAKDVYQGNVQTTRSFLPPTHVPLFDPREGRGISIHHQLGSVGYYTTGNSNSGNIDGILNSASISRYYDTEDLTNSPKLYVGVRRVGEPKWFYIPSRDVAVNRIYQQSYKNKQSYLGSIRKFKTDVYISGGEGVPNFDPINISGIVPLAGGINVGDSNRLFDSRVLQMHVCYMPNDKYYLMLYNENLPNLQCSGSPRKYWAVLESYGETNVEPWGGVGNFGITNASGVVGISPSCNSTFGYISTSGGISGQPFVPLEGFSGSQSTTNGSSIISPVFSAQQGTSITFNLNYVTSDGLQFSDYAWVSLLNEQNVQQDVVIVIRTSPSGVVVPAGGAPPSSGTTTPPAPLSILSGTSWSILGGGSGSCYGAGCGNTGWITVSYTVRNSGNYKLKFGVANWIDTRFNTALAIDNINIGGQPLPILF